MTAITDARFEEFTKTIKEFVEFDEETSGIVQEAINKVYGATPVATTPVATTTTKTSGWPTYLKEQAKIRKEQKKPSDDLMKEIGWLGRPCPRRSRPSTLRSKKPASLPQRSRVT